MIAYLGSSVLARAYLVDEDGHDDAVGLLADPQIATVTGTWTRIEVSGALVRAAQAGRGDEKGLLALLDADLAGPVVVLSAPQALVEQHALELVRAMRCARWMHGISRRPRSRCPHCVATSAWSPAFVLARSSETGTASWPLVSESGSVKATVCASPAAALRREQPPGARTARRCLWANSKARHRADRAGPGSAMSPRHSPAPSRDDDESALG